MKSHWVSVFPLFIGVIVIKYVTETLILLLKANICDVQISISYFDRILGNRESETQQVFNFASLWYGNFSYTIS